MGWRRIMIVVRGKRVRKKAKNKAPAQEIGMFRGGKVEPGRKS